MKYILAIFLLLVGLIEIVPRLIIVFWALCAEVLTDGQELIPYTWRWAREMTTPYAVTK